MSASTASIRLKQLARLKPLRATHTSSFPPPVTTLSLLTSRVFPHSLRRQGCLPRPALAGPEHAARRVGHAHRVLAAGLRRYHRRA
eukprot:6196636-Pleurochrysis_carterae.AAC.1